MQSSDYLTAWGFPHVFEDIDRLIDTRTHVFRFSPHFVTKGNVRSFDLFWEFERQQRICRVGFEVRAGRQCENDCLQRQPQNGHGDIWGIRQILLVPFEEDVCDVDYLDKSAKDVLILPGREKMCIDASGRFSLPPVELVRTYSCPDEVIRFELRTRGGTGFSDVRNYFPNLSSLEFNQIQVVPKACDNPVPIFRYLKQTKKLRSGGNRGLVRIREVQLEQPVEIVWHGRVVEVQGFKVMYIQNRSFRSLIKVSPTALILSRLVNSWKV